ncbi:MAG: DHH family phosphoesterase [bacterium]|uniref:Single-stranded-DNA-specific exonuclease RecJ n=2 Tax=Bacteria candidate phyla TaxID=1783234 RepID=A0A101I1P2_UNCT6|nr:MAG: Single-stranded-DNA-specific exonuclease RecJ [candidate division TA06 bacterium 32_111]KUK86839.1 MAG: Single-stranded-DNA-specific exonuclease RecJ [candidate division TA06 bacterium 34_109]MDI6700772.1 DHH family phosphoesterase [bacterium]HAF07322.1 hypothetical protein [candidate division WOR-3 bacterium]HCP16444.1 hypothetical protein [candidate division WOR-3 bacterium]
MLKVNDRDFIDKDFKDSYSIIKKSQKILVWGDEDADGITSTIIILRTLNTLGKKAHYFIPSRIKDGIGLVERKVDLFLKKDFDTFITVDCASVNYELIKKIKLSDKNIIVTDHHIPYKKKVEKVPYINPYLLSSKKFKNLSGSGVSFIFSLYLLKKFKIVKDYSQSFFYDPFNISLAAVGTKCDKVKVDKTNEKILKYYNGIFYHIPFLRELEFDETNLCGVFANSKTLSFKNPLVEYILKENYKKSFYLFLKDAKRKIENYKKRIEKYLNEIEKKSFEKEKYILIVKKNIEYKYTGVLASLLSKKYDKPVCIIGKKGKNFGGECRFDSENFNWLDTLKLFENYFIGFGGHKKAAGFEINSERIYEFVNEFNNRLNSSK